ncbi:MAG: alanine racemase [Alphaproteobacteria bacterium]|nr:alanine racemase [Alphaproteobacteria bacterium]
MGGGASLDCGHLTIDLSALASNYKTMCAKTTSEAKDKSVSIAAVVKADAYGLGLEAVAPALSKAGCVDFFVAQISEALQLRGLLPDATIYVLNGLGDTPAIFTKNNLIPCLINIEQIKLWQKAGDNPAALMLDIGFNRLGLAATDLLDLASDPTLFEGWQLKMIIGHLACSDDPDHPMNRAQAETFRDACATLPDAPKSLANSGGVLLGADYHFDMARCGIALYGGMEADGIKPVATLTAPLLQIRQIVQGESVGYSASFTASHDMQIGIIALGYGDGIPHRFGTKAQAVPLWLAEQAVPIIGKISMDTLAVNLTNLPLSGHLPPQIGDMVEVFGTHNPLPHLAKAGDTTAYELLTRLGKRTKRLYV